METHLQGNGQSQTLTNLGPSNVAGVGTGTIATATTNLAIPGIVNSTSGVAAAAAAAAATTSSSLYLEGVSSSLISHVLCPISDWLSTKPTDTSVQSMLNVLQIPIPTKPVIGTSALATPSSTKYSGMNIPKFMQGMQSISPTGEKRKPKPKPKTKATPTKTTKSSTILSSTSTHSTNDNKKLCTYIFQRGLRQGEPCERVVEDDGEFCKNCKKKKGVTNKVSGTSTSSNSSGNAPSNNQLSITNAPLGVQVVSSSMIVNPTKPDDQPELTVEDIPGRPGFFLELNHGFILEILANETVVALKVKDGSIERDLTEDEKQLAESLSLATIRDDKDKNRSEDNEEEEDVNSEDENDEGTDHSVPSIPKIPQLPSLSSFSSRR